MRKVDEQTCLIVLIRDGDTFFADSGSYKKEDNAVVWDFPTDKDSLENITDAFIITADRKVIPLCRCLMFTVKEAKEICPHCTYALDFVSPVPKYKFNALALLETKLVEALDYASYIDLEKDADYNDKWISLLCKALRKVYKAVIVLEDGTPVRKKRRIKEV